MQETDGIEFFKASELDSNVKATVHTSGKLGFSRNAEKKLGLEDAKSIRIGRGNDFEKSRNLFLLVQKHEDVDGFSILKAGEYYYANTKPLFDMLGEGYDKEKIIYDITEVIVGTTKVFKLKRRVKERKKSQSTDE